MGGASIPWDFHQVWGEDIILDRLEFIDHSQAVALTYVEAFTLRREDLDELLVRFPEVRASRLSRSHPLQVFARVVRGPGLKSDGFTTNQWMTSRMKQSAAIACFAVHQLSCAVRCARHSIVYTTRVAV